MSFIAGTKNDALLAVGNSRRSFLTGNALRFLLLWASEFKGREAAEARNQPEVVRDQWKQKQAESQCPTQNNDSGLRHHGQRPAQTPKTVGAHNETSVLAKKSTNVRSEVFRTTGITRPKNTARNFVGG
jgi:hypothetical protein